MTSKSSYSETGTVSWPSLLKENLKRRIWSAALCSLLFFFLLPVTMLLQVSHYLNESSFAYAPDPAAARLKAQQQLYRNFTGWVETDDIAMSFLLFLLAVVIAVSAFHWLHNAKKTDFYHSLPISRAKLFHATNLGSLLIAGVPYLVMSLIAAGITQAASGYGDCVWIALLGFAGHMGFFLLCYMTVVLAMMLTGNVFVGILGAGTFFFWGPSVITLASGLMSMFFKTYYPYEHFSEMLLHRSSAFLWMAEMESDPVSAAVRAGTAYAASLVLMGLCLLIYKKRPSEAAGRAMAFPKTEMPIKLLITVPVSLAAGLILFELMDSDLWAVFGLVCGLLIVGLVMEIIYRFDFRQLFSHKRHLLFGLLISFAVFMFFRFDLAGYDRYLPDPGNVSSAGVASGSLENLWNYNREFSVTEAGDAAYLQESHRDPEYAVVSRMQLHDVETVYRIASEGAAFTALSRRPFAAGRTDMNTVFEDGACPGTVVIAWHFADGKQKLRQYYMDLSKVHDELDRVHDDAEYKTAAYPVFDINAAILSGANYADIDGPDHIKFPSEAAKTALLKTYQEEFLALSAETRRQEMPVAALQFKTYDFQRMVDLMREKTGYIGAFQDYRFYPVYPSFTGTLKLLEEYGVRLNASLDPDRVESVIINDNRSFGEESWEQTLAKRKAPLVVKDPARIRELLSASVINSLPCSNESGPLYYGLDLSVRTNADAASERSSQSRMEYDLPAPGSTYEHDGSIDFYSYNLNLSARDIPDFVKEYFEIDDEDIRENSTHTY